METGSITRYNGDEQIGQQQKGRHRHNHDADHPNGLCCVRGDPDLVIARELSTIPPMSRFAARTEESSDASFTARLNAAANETDHLLDRLLASTPADGETARPKRLIEAMRYASLGGGKRLRPFLTVETAALFGVPREHALMAGAAIECIHCYSLVHDDLPAMDDDDLRRGRPTVHKAFDEATAILAGDGLLTFAFDILGAPGDPSRRRRARCAGGGPCRAPPASAAWSAARCWISRPKAVSARTKPRAASKA